MSYHYATLWIAHNDSAGDATAHIVSEVANLVTVLLVADLFNKTPEQVAKDVVRFRTEKP